MLTDDTTSLSLFAPIVPAPINVGNVTSSPMFTTQELKWIDEMRAGIRVADHPIYTNDFNLLRWASAYEGNIQIAVKKYQRHLRIREILQLDFVENLKPCDGIDDEADSYAPMSFLGEV